MLVIEYDPTNKVVYNDNEIYNYADYHVKNSCFTDEIITIKSGQELFLTAIRAIMKQHKIDHNQAKVLVFFDGQELEVSVQSNYRFNTNTPFPDIMTRILLDII